jgi:hypothetical protein
LASPATMASEGRCHFGQRLPSTRIIAGSKPSASTGAGHRQHPRPVDVDPVDLLDAGDADADSRDL